MTQFAALFEAITVRSPPSEAAGRQTQAWVPLDLPWMEWFSGATKPRGQRRAFESIFGGRLLYCMPKATVTTGAGVFSIDNIAILPCLWFRSSQGLPSKNTKSGLRYQKPLGRK